MPYARTLSSLTVVAGVLLLCLRAPAEEGKRDPRTLKGAKQVAEGHYACVSADGTQFAFARLKVSSKKVDYRGDPIPQPQLYVQAVGKKRGSKRSAKSVPQGWTGPDTIGMSAGHVVTAKGGKKTKGFAAMPKGLEGRRVSWSRDGQWLVYVPDQMFYDINPDIDPPASATMTLHLVDAEGTVKPLDLGYKIRTDICALISWSPDGKRFAFDLEFFRNGNTPVRRKGVYDLESGETKLVMMGSQTGRGDWITSGGCEVGHRGDKGIRENTPGVSRRGNASCSCGGHDLWDGKGEYFTFIARPEEDKWDAYVATADGETKYRVTSDGAMKWSACLDAAGRRIAYWTAEDGKANRPPSSCHIEILDLYTGEVLIIPAPEDEGIGSGICWIPGKPELLFEWTHGHEGTIWHQKVPKAGKLPEDAAIRTSNG